MLFKYPCTYIVYESSLVHARAYFVTFAFTFSIVRNFSPVILLYQMTIIRSSDSQEENGCSHQTCKNGPKACVRILFGANHVVIEITNP